MTDSPPYAGTQTVLNLVQSAARFGSPTLAALDHDGAYSALPVREPEECYVFVPSDGQPSVFRHLVLPFGGTGSVWSHLRIADIECFLTITRVITAAHLVNDYFYSEPAHTSLSAFTSFCAFQSLLGFQMKEAKAQKPTKVATLLVWSILDQLSDSWSEPFEDCQAVRTREENPARKQAHARQGRTPRW